MKDKTILITGSTDGIGKQTALDLAKMGATVLLHGRNSGRADRVLNEIKKATGNDRIEAFIADLASLKQVRYLAEQVLEKHDRLDVLINNAGVYETRHRISEDGFEMTFAVNHLAPFFLTLLLLDLIGKRVPCRIINVSSQVHASSIDFDNLQAEKHYSAYEAYSLSKLCNVLFTSELAERLKGTGITVNCLHPGVIDTKLLKAGWGMGGSPVTQGAKTSVYLATAPELSTVTGKYFKNMKPTKSSRISYDAKARKRLWEISERLCQS
ncbi:MAG: SDR family oxidoreductase [Deltaproteobacteria bacterium]|nr:SDR family oxidoreductase [Deltaproteobacteria bacterium]